MSHMLQRNFFSAAAKLN